MKYLSCLAVVLCCSRALAQTVGIGDVTSIEAKSLRIATNKTLIAEGKADLEKLRLASAGKLKKLQDELAALYKERDDLIGDMKVGAKCSKCGEWKSSFEKRGEDFEKHLGTVSGVAVPATTEQLEATRKVYGDKIAYKKVQILNAEKGGEAMQQKQADIAQLEQTNATLCEEITAHSKTYESKVFADAKDHHNSWTNSLLEYATAILIADDKIAINQARLVRAENRFIDQAKGLAGKELASAKSAHEQNKLEINQAVETAKEDLLTARKVYAEKVAYFTRKKDAEVNTVVSESNRMVVAGQRVTCAVGNETRFKVAGNWNQVFPCVNALTKLAKPYSTHVFNAYCPGKSSQSYMAQYKTFLLSLSAEDKAAVQGNSNTKWFEYVTQ